MSASITTLASFNGTTEGAYPNGGLIADANGDLFGTTSTIDPNDVSNPGQLEADGGTVFELAKTASGYASAPVTLTELDALTDGHVNGGLLFDANGNLIGSTDDTIFEISNSGSGYASAPLTLARFANTDDPSILSVTGSGDLLGATEEGGANGVGSLFEIARTGAGYAAPPTTLVSFDGADGAYGDILTTNSAGDLFGATPPFNAASTSTVFEIAISGRGDAGTPVTLASFQDYLGVTSLVADAAGDLFGILGEGGPSHQGSIFEIANTDTGYAAEPITLASFDQTDGGGPGGLVIDASGNLFGLTSAGGPSGDGTIFELAKTASGYAASPTTLVSFDGADGSEPNSLMLEKDGSLIGTTGRGGASGDGTLFEVAFGDSNTERQPAAPKTAAPANLSPSAPISVPPGALTNPGPLSNVFIQGGTGNDILIAQGSGEHVLDDAGGMTNFEIGGTGKNAFFFDASQNSVSWNTVVGLHSGDFAAIFGITPQDVLTEAANGLGAAGYTGLTLRTFVNGKTAFVTLAGYDTESLNNGSLVTGFGTDPANGREYLLIEAK